MSRYCSYIAGMCVVNNVRECAKRNPEECRKCRQANVQKEKEKDNGSVPE